MSNILSRDKTIQTRVTDKEFKRIDEKSNFLGLSMSNYLRLIALHANVKVDIAIINDEK